MINFSQYLKEEFLVESAETTWGLQRNNAGKMHEVLTGGLINHYASVYQANKEQGHEEAHKVAMDAIINPVRSTNKKKVKVANIAHMEQFRDESANKSAGEWHTHLSDQLSQNNYDNHLTHAAHAATNIIKHLHEQGVTDIRRTHFTANAKDIATLTNNKDSLEQGNNSDIVIEHGHKNEGGRFFGVSLKSGKEKKAFSPGAEKISHVVDQYFEKITQKKGSFSVDTQAASDAAQKDHHRTINRHASALKSILGKSGISDTSEGSRITESGLKTIRYAQEILDGEVKPKDAKGKANPEHTRKKKALSKYTAKQQQQLATVYRDLRASRLKHHKRAVTQSLTRHMSEIFSSKHDSKSKVHQLRRDLVAIFTNTPSRPEGSMRIMRHNTILNRDGNRKSEIGYGLGDTAKETRFYGINSGDGINFTISGYRDKARKSKSLHIQGHSDSSPSEGSGFGIRKTIQFSLRNVKDGEKKKSKKNKLKESLEPLKEKINYLLEKKSNQEKIMAAAKRAGAIFSTLQQSKQRDKSRLMTDAEARQENEKIKTKTSNREAMTSRKEARAAQSETDLSWTDYTNKVTRGVTGIRAISQLTKTANLEAPNQFKIEEDAPANAMGAAGISGAETAVDAGIAGYDFPMGMVHRAPPKMFGGKRVFTVPSKDYYKATLGRRKGQHWRSMVNGPLGEDIRQYALENKEAPIIVEDETTGAMMFLRYGKR